jgi:hypothetical protein
MSTADKMTVDEMPVDKMPFDKMTHHPDAVVVI